MTYWKILLLSSLILQNAYVSEIDNKMWLWDLQSR